MGTKLTTVSVRLDQQASIHVDKAAHVLRQSKGAFLAQAGEEAAERVLLQWAGDQYAAGVASLSELAAETHLPLERIAQHVAAGHTEQATEMYLASCQQLAHTLRMPKFYLLAKKAVRQARQELVQEGMPRQER
jgi:predicted transcriptional regulator